MPSSREWANLDSQVRRALGSIEGASERRILAAYARALKELRVEMSKLYEKVNTPDGKLTLAEMTKYNRYNTLDIRIAEIMRDEYKIVVKELQRLPAEMYDEAFFRYAWAFDQNAGVAISWGTVSKETLAAISSNPLDLISRDTLSTIQRNRIRSSIAQGLIQGKSYPQMMKGVKSAMGNTVYEAMRIARTEGQRAANKGSAAVYERAVDQGIRGREIWDATLDGRTRPSHGELDGKERPKDGLWKVVHEGELVETPGPLMAGPASFVIHCRCRIRFEVEGYEPQIRRTRDAGIIPYVSYDNWRPNLNATGRYARRK